MERMSVIESLLRSNYLINQQIEYLRESLLLQKFKRRMASLGKCHSCNKTTYQLEGVRVGPPGKEMIFHKLCFKCQNEGCGWQLTLGSYKFCDGKVNQLLNSISQTT